MVELNTLGARLSYARKKNGYTQEALAASIGVSRGVIFNLEKNKTRAQSIVSTAICRVLNLNEEWLLNGVGEMEVTQTNPVLSELYQVAGELTEAQQLFLLDVIRAMKCRLYPTGASNKKSEHSDIPGA